MASGRIETIDVVRGFAVLGILLMNIIGFGWPGAAYLNPVLSGGDGAHNLGLWAVSAVAVDGKMRALFAMLFGASMLLMAEKYAPADAAGRHAARMAVLFGIGMAHAWLLWSGDILVTFAIVGTLVFQARGLPVPKLFLLAGIALVLQALLTLSFGWTAIRMEAAAALPDASAAAKQAWAEMAATTWTPAEDLARETQAMLGGPADILRQRAQTTLFSQTFLIPFLFFLETSGLMLAGMALYRLGWWQGAYARRTYRRVAGVAILSGWAVGAYLAWRYWQSGFVAAAYFLTDAARVLVAPLVAIGYSAALIAIVKTAALPRLSAGLAAVGQMALTNYLLASVLANLVFTGVGLGLYAKLDRPQILLVVMAIWAVQLIGSILWLRWFRQGPFEWLWRSLARWERQPIRRAAT